MSHIKSYKHIGNHAERVVYANIEKQVIHWRSVTVAFLLGFLVGCFTVQSAQASGVSSASNYNPAAVAITGGSISGISILDANTYVSVGGGQVYLSGGDTSSNSFSLVGRLLFSKTAPTIASGFCGLGSAVSNTNGTATFTIATGTGACGASGVITMPAATTAWNCTWSWSSFAVPDPDKTFEFSATSTSVTMYAYTASTGAASVFVINKKINVNCVGY